MPNYSGIWTPTQQMQAVAAGTWTGITQYELYSWGDNSAGKLGSNTNGGARSSPVQIGSATHWAPVGRNIAAGEFFIAIANDGTLWSWGENIVGQLGRNNLVNTSSPTQVGALTNWANCSNGQLHAIALKTDGTMWSWGNNQFGELGQNDVVARSSPVQIGANTDWAVVATSVEASAAIKTNGTVWTWGRGTHGAMGNSDTVNVSSPTQVGALTTWSTVIGNGYGFTAIKTDGTLWLWGLGNYGQLGQNSTASRSSPVQVGALTNWAKLGGGYFSNAAIKTDGTLWTWGYGEFGQLGQGFSGGAGARSSPVQVGSLTTWNHAIMGFYTCAAIQTDGTLWAMGRNNSGQLGINSTVYKSSPTQVGSNTNWSWVQNNNNAMIGYTQTTT